MSQIFDRLGNLIRSTFQDTVLDDLFEDPLKSDDSDFNSAWEELEGFLNSDDFANEEPKHHTHRASTAASVPAEVTAAYMTLGLSFGASFDDVKKAYKTQILKYHPDRFASDPVKLKEATEKAKKINQAFTRIKKYEETDQ